MKTLLKYTNQDLTHFRLKIFELGDYRAPVLRFSEFSFATPYQFNSSVFISRLISKTSVRPFHTSNISPIPNIKVENPLEDKKDKFISSKHSDLLTFRSKQIAVSLTKRKVYWNPRLSGNSFSLNDYQYIKCKWLFELLIGGYVVIHKDFGLIMSSTFLFSTFKGQNEFRFVGARSLPAPRIYSSNWTNELLGDRADTLYYSVLNPRTKRALGLPQRV